MARHRDDVVLPRRHNFPTTATGDRMPTARPTGGEADPQVPFDPLPVGCDDVINVDGRANWRGFRPNRPAPPIPIP